MSTAEKKGWFQRWRGRGGLRGDSPDERTPQQDGQAGPEREPQGEAQAMTYPPPPEPPSPPPPFPEPPPVPEETPPPGEPPVEEPPPERPPPDPEQAGGGWFRRRSDEAEGGEAGGGRWYRRLRQGLSRSSNRLRENIAAVFTRRRLDQESLDELEDLLIQADLGVEAAARLVEEFGRTRFGREVGEQEVRTALADAVSALLEPVAKPLVVDPAHRPEVILVCGVNGTGKTTTIGKLAQQFRNDGRRVLLAAGDTFRAAAIEQLEIWGERTGCEVVSRPTGADAAGLAYDALARARAEAADVLLIDTAGRLHNKAALMDELAKIVRVLKKLDPEAPHQTLLVLDATTGQNARNQVETFAAMVPISGLIVTKLDGTARGGVAVALAERFGLPVHAVGVGEGVDDLRPFEARAFADALLGVERA